MSRDNGRPLADIWLMSACAEELVQVKLLGPIQKSSLRITILVCVRVTVALRGVSNAGKTALEGLPQAFPRLVPDRSLSRHLGGGASIIHASQSRNRAPLRQQIVDSESGEVVASHNKGGYEVGENQFLIVQDEELEAARQEGRGRPFGAAPSRPTAAPQSKDEMTGSC